MIKRSFILILFSLCTFLEAKPSRPTVVHGRVETSSSEKSLEIKTSDLAIINWKSFSIASDEKVRFIQPDSSSRCLNRVTGLERSLIYGRLEANGQIYLINPRGILVGPGGVIESAGFVGSTFDLLDGDFIEGKSLRFQGSLDEKVINFGKIQALGGDLILVGAKIENRGQLIAEQGKVRTAAGRQILLVPDEKEPLFIEVPLEQSEEIGIEQAGEIKALEVELMAHGAYHFAIKQSGKIEANRLQEKDGRILLVGNQSKMEVSGELTAKKVHILADEIGVISGAKIDVSGQRGGGEVLIGGDYQGKNPQIPNAKVAIVEEGVEIYANAGLNGDGGRVIVWSDKATGFSGQVFARGGLESGDGGFVEVSSKEQLVFSGGRVDTSAVNGKTGMLLLDPTNVTTSAAATTGGVTFSGGNYNFGSLNVANIRDQEIMDNLLNSNVTISTNTTGTSSAGTLNVNTALDWNTSNTLTLIANSDLTVGARVANSGNGNLSLISLQGNVIFRPLLAFSDIPVLTTSGNFTVQAAQDVVIDSGTGSVRVGIFEDVNGGNLSITAGRDLFVIANTSGSQAMLITSVRSNIFTIGRDLIVRSGANDGTATIGLSNGVTPMHFTVGRDVQVLAHVGGGLAAYATIGATIIDDNPIQTQAGPIFFQSIGRNVILQGGANTFSFAAIGVSSFSLTTNQTFQQELIFGHIGGNISLTAGSALGTPAQIGYLDLNNSLSTHFVGNINLQQVAGSVTLLGSSSSTNTQAIIGHGNAGCHPADNFTGSITIAGASAVTLQGGSSQGSSAIIGFDTAINSTTSFVESGFVRLLAEGSITLNAGNGSNAVIGYYNNFAGTSADVAISTVQVEADRASLTLNPGNNGGTGGGVAAIGTLVTSGSAAADVSILCRDLLLNPPAGANDGIARITSGNIGLQGGFDVEIRCENATIGTGSTNPQADEIFSLRNLQIVADDDIVLQSEAYLHTVAGELTLVVDEEDPERPEIGPGSFVKAADALITTAGPLRIFTAMRQQNQIAGLINGSAFVPGPLFVNSATEEWNVYFSDNEFSGFPFTIFYKNSIHSGSVPNVFHEYFTAQSEALRDLDPYDDLIFSRKLFILGYDRRAYELEFYPKNSSASFMFFDDEKYVSLIKKYLNYNTKKLAQKL